MRYIGLSLSNCVKDILDDKINIEDVIMIITNTRITSRENLINVMGTYMQSYWKDHHLVKVLNVIETLFFSGKILQPRVLRLDGCPHLPGNYWVSTTTDVVDNFLNAVMLSPLDQIGRG